MTISHATQSTNCASGNHIRTIEPKKYPKPEDSAEINSFKKLFTRNRLLVGKTYASFAYKHRSVAILYQTPQKMLGIPRKCASSILKF